MNDKTRPERTGAGVGGAAGAAASKFSRPAAGTRAAQAGVALEKAILYITWLVPVLEAFPRSQRFLLGDRLQALALDVVDALIEATYSKAPQASLRRCNLLLEKQRVLVRVAYNLRHLDDTFARLRGRGQHRAIARFESFRDRFSHVLRSDIYRYFPSIDHAVLKDDLRRRIGCRRTLDLLDRIIDGANPRNLRAANRNRNTPDNRNNTIGFRLASTLVRPEPRPSRRARACRQASRPVRESPRRPPPDRRARCGGRRFFLAEKFFSNC